jgi:4-amino-4-deoxy-L-arabinose transferase-like glycosyltransferase
MSTRRFAGELRSLSVNQTAQQLSLSRLFEDRRVHFCLIAAMSLLVLFARLHQGDLGGYDDAVYAHEGKQMLATGQWWSVYLNGQPDFDKPPMFVWLEALSMLLFGLSDFAARFPSALLGFGAILLVFFIARELTTSYWLPVWAMMILFSTQMFMKFAMRAMTDVPFTFFFALAVLFYLKGLKRNRHFILCGLAVSLAILTRSFLGAIPLGVFLIHLAVTGRAHLLRSKQLIVGTLLAVTLPLVWFVSQYQLHGSQFLSLHFSFTFDNLPLTNGKSAGQLGAGLFRYPLFLLESYWPWLPLMIAGLWMQTKKMVRERDSAGSLLVIWVSAVIVPFGLAEFKWLRYIMPVFPAFAILSAVTINEWLTVRVSSPTVREGLAPATSPSLTVGLLTRLSAVNCTGQLFFLKAAYIVLCLALAAMAFNPKYRLRPEEMRRLAPVAEAATHPGQRILLYTERPARDAHLFQVIWYADRHCELLTETNEAMARLASEPNAAVIMDKEVFRTSIGNADPSVKILGETEGFVCWTKINQSDSVEARNDVGEAFGVR